MTSESAAPAPARPDDAWLDAEGLRLLAFAAAARRDDGGFGWLGRDGRLVPDRGTPMWITARMTHVFSLAHLRGQMPPGVDAAALADHGVAALTGPLRDERDGGWFSAVPAPTERTGDTAATAKSCYEHAFVVLAAASATEAGRPAADALLGEALDVMERRFWREDEGRCAERYARDWGECEAYRGANSNMHAVEAFLAAADALTGLGDSGRAALWRDRALRIAAHLVHDVARHHDDHVVEHFDAEWNPLPEYNADRPADPFRPYGATIGHSLEWARLLLHLEAAMATGTAPAPEWLLPDAQALFAAAVREGWAVDGADGFVYTVGWDGRPVVRARMHWVAAEAIAAAAALHRRTGDPAYAGNERAWWDYTRRHLVDTAGGSWHHELDPANRPATTTWDGKPDVYHAYQATLLPRLPLAPAAASALARGPR